MNSNIEYINNKYIQLCNTKSDIHEHLPVISTYASKCESVIECGVRKCVSSWALLKGLLANEYPNKRLLLNDITPCTIDELLENTKDLDIQISHEWCSNLELKLECEYDLVFIDTWHVYGQLKRELTKFGKVVKRYIIMHDTTVDEIFSESVRNRHNIEDKMEMYDFTREEVTVGLGRAISEFLESNPEWKLVEKYTNNNGLTILEKT
jgi:hypothetical protein